MNIKNSLKLLAFLLTIQTSGQISDKDLENQSKAAYYSHTNLDSLFKISRILEKSSNSCIRYNGKTNVASAYYKSGNFKKSEEISLKVLFELKGATTTCDKNNKFNALTRLFWIKNSERKFNEAIKYLNQRRELLESYSDRDDKYLTKKIKTKTNLALVKNNLGFHREAIELAKQAIIEYSQIKNEFSFIHNYPLKINRSSTYNIIGDSYFRLNSYSQNSKHLDSCLINYKKAFLVTEKFYPKHKNSKSLYNLRIARVLIKKGQFIEALKKVNNCDLLDKSQDFNFLKSLIFKKLKKIDSSLYYSYEFLKFKNKSPDTQKNKIVVYNILAGLYNERNKIDSAFKYSKLAMGMLKEFNENKSNAHKIHHLYGFNKIKKVNNYIIKNEFNKRKQLIILFLLIIFSGLIFGYFFLKRKKEKYDYLGPTTKKEYSINIEIEEMVLKNLKEFELSKDYLDSTFSIHQLAKNLNTNTSYLSSIINEKKEKTYKQYITELRINYLIKILTTNSKFRKYTVQALGEEIGYTNASSFARSFKNYLGKTPKDYINSLKK